MPDRKVKVAVNGYRVIGKRVADAVALQDDMDLVGVADVVSDYRIRVAIERGYRVYAAQADKRAQLVEACIPVGGDLDDLLGQADIVVDCTPKGIAAKNKARYLAAGVKAIFQGGEPHDLTGFSFVAQVNYAAAVNRDIARVVSCNTTALCRILYALQVRGWVKKARGVLLRRAADAWESHLNGMINTVVPEMRVPTHQGPDAQSVIPDLKLTTLAAEGPFDLSHLHFLIVETHRPVTRAELREALHETPRVALVRGADGLAGLNSVIELMRDLGRPRNDMWEVAVWEDALASDGEDLYLTYQVDNEAIVIPETIDCIRALSGIEPDGLASIRKTNQALGIDQDFLPMVRPIAGSHHSPAFDVAVH